MSQDVLAVNGICKNYADFSLKNVTFHVPGGSIVGLVGENGAGKSTTLKAILNICSVDEGSVEFYGKEIPTLSGLEKEDIGVVFDDSVFYENLTALELEKIFSRIYKKWDCPYFLELLNRFHISADKKLSEYSKGMKSKLALVSALSHYPKLLVIDEALSALDPVIRDEVLQMLHEFVADGEKAVLFSCHIVEDLQKIADYIVFINHGKVAFEKSLDDLLCGNAIIHCCGNQMGEIEKEDVIAYCKEGNETAVMIRNYGHVREKYQKFSFKQTTMNEILKIMMKGEWS